VERREAGEAHSIEPTPAGRSRDAAYHIIAADQVGDAMRTDQPGRRLPVKLGDANDMRAACDRGHRGGIAKRATKRHRRKQHCIWRVESYMARNVDGVARDGLLIV
jgi:hypothetical protein